MNASLTIILIHTKSGIFSHSIEYFENHMTHRVFRSLRARDLFFDDATHDNKGRLQKQSEIF